ncbi:uncharacterized protein BKA55DRAFT_583546 [Fusarium redolens]|uniref:Uncharacterized protein n=1 Tax=Fusarium redolens TaxID=48865 RepID=A0A9P9JS67_FUSRE|nr:uncharacterized protein BKA55DRAFT_583546 [Fusarium redolens]KAH7230160.1 hypothetical protein BKA55DRAFT_583546 [Fusarium redolens]
MVPSRTRLLSLGRVAPEASGTNLLPDWFPQRVERVKRLITGRSTGSESPIPCSGVAKTTRRLGGSSLITSCWSSAHLFPCRSGWLRRFRNGASQHAERDDWVRRRRGPGALRRAVGVARVQSPLVSLLRDHKTFMAAS